MNPSQNKLLCGPLLYWPQITKLCDSIKKILTFLYLTLMSSSGGNPGSLTDLSHLIICHGCPPYFIGLKLHCGTLSGNKYDCDLNSFQRLTVFNIGTIVSQLRGCVHHWIKIINILSLFFGCQILLLLCFYLWDGDWHI